MKTSSAEITREYGPFPGVEAVHGVSYDGEKLWFATGDTLRSLDPASGKELRSIDVAAHAGTAFDGLHFFQLAEDRIQKIDPKTGDVLATSQHRRAVPPGSLGRKEASGWVSIGTTRSIRSTPKLGPSSGQWSSTASSLA